MRIAFFVHCFFPRHFYGTERYTLKLARHYQSLGHEVTVVSAIFQGTPSVGELISKYEYQGIPVVCIDKNSLPHGRVKETYYQPEMRGVLETVLRNINPDLVHVTHLVNHTSALLEITQQLAIPTHATFTDFFGFCLNNKLEAADGSLCAGPSVSRTNCVACHLKEVAHSPHSSQWIRRVKGASSAKFVAGSVNLLRNLPGLRGGPIDGLIEDIVRRPDTLSTLYNAGYKSAVAPTKFLRRAYESNGIKVPLHDIHFGIDIDRAEKSTRSSTHIPVIGFIGQIAPHKGTDLLVEAFCRLPKKSAELRIYGPEDQDPTYMSRLKNLAAQHNVRFMGTFEKETTATIFGELDLLVIPSIWYENSPLVLLSALATHTPVLVSDVAGMTEFLEEGRNGYSFQRGSVDHLEKILAELVRNPEKLYFLAENTNYERTPRMMAEDTLLIY